jgi:hypothetical protein
VQITYLYPNLPCFKASQFQARLRREEALGAQYEEIWLGDGLCVSNYDSHPCGSLALGGREPTVLLHLGFEGAAYRLPALCERGAEFQAAMRQGGSQ